MTLGPEVRRGGNLPFGMFASQWACDPRYSTNARTLYTILVTYADTQSRNTERGKPYRSALAAELGVSVSTVDRTLAEMEIAGMVRIEARVDPDNPANNEANVYHLLDFPLMYAGNGEWADPLASGVNAAEVAKRVIEERRAAKREQGIERRGGVPKGVNPRAVKAARAAEEPSPSPEGGSSTHAATPGSTHAAGVAAPVLPNIQNPVYNPLPEPDAPLARSADDARRAPAGSRDRTAGGSAASGNSRRRLSRAQYEAIAAVRNLLPDDLVAALPVKMPANVSAAIVDALAGGAPYERTPAQLVEYRVLRRWNGYWAPKFYAGELKSVVGPLLAMLEFRQECGDISCEDRVDIHTGEPCGACTERRENQRSVRATEFTPDAPEPSIPQQPDTPGDDRPRGKCVDCQVAIFVFGPAVHDGLCRECRADRAALGR